MKTAASGPAIREQIGEYVHIDISAKAVEFVRERLGSLHGLTVLEAGCGSGSYLDLAQSYVVGIDLSQRQLDKNRVIQERHQGDLHVYDNESWRNRFDLIVCWDVIEHLYDPRIVIDKFETWLKPGGTILLAYPNPQALKAVVTKYTPLSFHRLAKRWARPETTATFQRENTFQTYMHQDMRLLRILDQAAKNQCEIPLLVSHQSRESRFYKKFFGERLMNAANAWFLGDLRSFIDRRSTDFIVLIRKRTV